MDHLGRAIWRPLLELFRVPLVASLTPITTYNGEPVNFHNFSHAFGLESEDDFLRTISDSHPLGGSSGIWSHDSFAQRWLFFELLNTTFSVLGDKFRHTDFIEAAGHVSTLESQVADSESAFKYLGSQRKESYFIHTKNLRGYLRLWKKFETDPQLSNGRLRRLFQSQQVLQRAKLFVFRHCSVQEGNSTAIWQIDKRLCLSFMVLGETLSRTLDEILKLNDLKLVGWTNNDPESSGWGYSQLALETLRQINCCPRTIRMLKTLFRNNSIALLMAIPSVGDLRIHSKCRESECVAFDHLPPQWAPSLPQKGNKYYKYYPDNKIHYPQHWVSCTSPSSCSLVGPKSSDLEGIIRAGQIPLIRYDALGTTIIIDGLDNIANGTVGYSAISHMWADGLAHPSQNKVYSCQLQRIQNLTREANSHLLAGFNPEMGRPEASEFFWIDCLCIPTQSSLKQVRELAIVKMAEIYQRARCTIVLDNTLLSTNCESNYTHAVMKVIMSPWMSRAWTLQECLVSKELWYQFHDGIYSLQRLEKEYRKQANEIETALALVARDYYHSMLGKEAKTTNEVQNLRSPVYMSVLLQALQWRKVDRLDEAFCLAQLLGIDWRAERREMPQDNVENGMTRLLELMADLSPHSIPAGLIFIPGPRLKRDGFKWAPQSWVSHEYCKYSIPQDVTETITFLDGHGLNVELPGFGLHNFEETASPLYSRQSFQFPADAQLHEWYDVRDADHRIRYHGTPQDGSWPFAILTMEIPTNNREVIGLLVKIAYKTTERFVVWIYKRIYISRINDHQRLYELSTPFRKGHFEGILCGERLSQYQKWRVDGFITDLQGTRHVNSSAISSSPWKAPYLEQWQTNESYALIHGLKSRAKHDSFGSYKGAAAYLESVADDDSDCSDAVSSIGEGIDTEQEDYVDFYFPSLPKDQAISKILPFVFTHLGCPSLKEAVEQVFKTFDPRWFCPAKTRGGGDNAAGAQTCNLPLNTASQQSSQSSSNKHNNEDDPADGQNRKRKRRDVSPSSILANCCDEDRRFACPFYKYSPTVFCANELTKSRFRVCAGPGFKDTHQMKDHLYRCHLQHHQCSRCGEEYASPEELVLHLRTDPPCPTADTSRLIVGLSSVQIFNLKRKRKTNRTEEEKWNEIYRTIFPHVAEEDMPSPYYLWTLDGFVMQARGHIREEFYRLMREQATFELEESQLSDIADAIASLLARMLRQYHSWRQITARATIVSQEESRTELSTHNRYSSGLGNEAVRNELHATRVDPHSSSAAFNADVVAPESTDSSGQMTVTPEDGAANLACSSIEGGHEPGSSSVETVTGFDVNTYPTDHGIEEYLRIFNETIDADEFEII